MLKMEDTGRLLLTPSLPPLVAQFVALNAVVVVAELTVANVNDGTALEKGL